MSDYKLDETSEIPERQRLVVGDWVDLTVRGEDGKVLWEGRARLMAVATPAAGGMGYASFHSARMHGGRT